MMEKPSENNRRQNLFSKLDDVIEIAHKKVTAERGNADTSKQAWGRLMVQAVGVYGNLLKDVELEKLASDIEEIKEHLGMKTE